MTLEDTRYGLFVSIVEEQNDVFMQLFENAHLDVDASLNKYNWTALQTAAYTGNSDLVHYLLSKGADLSLTNKRGLSALQMAIQSGHQHLVDILTPSAAPQSHSSSFNDEGNHSPSECAIELSLE